MIIYKTTNLINNKIYVGKDSYNDPSYIGSGVLIKKDIRKYGKKNFKKEIIEKCETQLDLSKREIYWIKKLNSTNLDIGYNLNTGGSGGRHSDITRKKMRTTALKRDRSFYEDPIRNKKISDAKKGKKRTEESINKQKKWNEKHRKRKVNPPHQLLLFNGFFGCKRSPEFKEKFSKLYTGFNNPNSKIYYVSSPQGKKYIFENRQLLIDFFNDLNKFTMEHPRKMISPNTLLSNGNNKGWIVIKELRKKLKEVK